jgi:hypothetical protein
MGLPGIPPAQNGIYHFPKSDGTGLAQNFALCAKTRQKYGRSSRLDIMQQRRTTAQTKRVQAVRMHERKACRHGAGKRITAAAVIAS